MGDRLIQITKDKLYRILIVRKQTPKVEKQAKARKTPKGRAYKRLLYNRRYAPHILAIDPKKRKSPNWHAGKKEKMEAGANPPVKA